MSTVTTARETGRAWADRRWNELSPRHRPIVWSPTMIAAERECERAGLPLFCARTVQQYAADRWRELAGKR